MPRTHRSVCLDLAPEMGRGFVDILDDPFYGASGGEKEQDASHNGRTGRRLERCGVGGHLRAVEGHPVVEGCGGHGVGLVVDDDQAVVVAVEQVDKAFENPVADDGADVGLPPVRAVRGAPDDFRFRVRRGPTRSRCRRARRRPRRAPARRRRRRGRHRWPGRRSAARRARHGRSRCRTGPCSTAAARGRGRPWPGPGRQVRRAGRWLRRAGRREPSDPSSCEALTAAARAARARTQRHCLLPLRVRRRRRNRRPAHAQVGHRPVYGSAERRRAGRVLAGRREQFGVGETRSSAGGFERSLRCSDTTRWSRARVQAT